MKKETCEMTRLMQCVSCTLHFLHDNPSSSRVEIAAAFSDTPNERILKRMIAGAVQRGDLVVEGEGTACACVVILYSIFCRRQQTNGTNHGQCNIDGLGLLPAVVPHGRFSGL